MSLTSSKPPGHVFHQTHQGASHIRDNKVCQDHSDSRIGNKYALTVVSDGHGSDKYFRSDRGAKFVCEATIDAVKDFMKACIDNKNSFRNQVKADPDDHLNQLEQHILYLWNTKVEEDVQGTPFTEEERQLLGMDGDDGDTPINKAYGCTLIATVVYFDEFWFGLHIGDGKCVAIYEDGRIDQPIPWDDKCFLNVTTSLCDRDAVDNFRHVFRTDNFPKALFIASDGVDDSFANDEALHHFYQELFRTFREKGIEKTEEELKEYLPTLSQKGSQDDISIAGILQIQYERPRNTK